MHMSVAYDSAATKAGAEIFDFELGDEFLASLNAENVVAEPESEVERQQLEMFSAGVLIEADEPAIIYEYDDAEDVILFGYDPALTPDPTIELVDGDRDGQKLLLMNGKPVVNFVDAATLRLSDINVFEMALVS